MIRLAMRDDLPAIRAVYAPYVLSTRYSYEYEVPSLEEFGRRFDEVTAFFPWLVWEEGGAVRGYAYASRAFERLAFQWDADLAIYLDESVRGKGVGTKLYDCLEDILTQMGFCNAYALVTSDNLVSRAFHEKRGYLTDGLLRNTGYKLGAWQDLYWYRLPLNAYEAAMKPPVPFKPEMLR